MSSSVFQIRSVNNLRNWLIGICDWVGWWDEGTEHLHEGTENQCLHCWILSVTQKTSYYRSISLFPKWQTCTFLKSAEILTINLFLSAFQVIHLQAAESVHIRIDRLEYEAPFRNVVFAWPAVSCTRGHQSITRTKPNRLALYLRAARAGKQRDTHAWHTQTRVLPWVCLIWACTLVHAHHKQSRPSSLWCNIGSFWSTFTPVCRKFDSCRNIFCFLSKQSCVLGAVIWCWSRWRSTWIKTEEFPSMDSSYIMRQVWSISHHIWYHLKVSVKGSLGAH